MVNNIEKCREARASSVVKHCVVWENLARHVVLDTDDEAAVQRDGITIRVGRNKDRREVDRQQRLVVVVRAQTVVQLVQTA